MHKKCTGSLSLMQLYLLFSLFTSYVIYEVHQAEVRPEEFAVSHSKKIDANPLVFFNFITQTHVLEKLLPWLSRLKEADSRVLGVGKFYKAFSNIILGTEKIHLSIVDFKPGKYLTLESNDQSIKQRIEIRTKCYLNQTILSTVVYSRRTSMLFHNTIGRIYQYFIVKRLEKSLSNVSQIYKAIENELQIFRS